MHNSLTRVQNVFGFFTSVAFAVACAIAVSVFLHPQAPAASLELRNVQVVKGRPHYYSTKREEYAHVKFDLDADLTSLFSWNTKQIFLYITASYPSSNPSTIPPSESVIWDAIIPADNSPFHPNTYIHPTPKNDPSSKKSKKTKRSAASKPYPPGGSPGIVQLSNQKPKYQITDISGKLASRSDATLTLHWNVQPWVGALWWTNEKRYGLWAGRKGGE
ncbi:signal peptidase 22 kDa subunit, partial [Hortaea werneckii]